VCVWGGGVPPEFISGMLRLLGLAHDAIHPRSRMPSREQCWDSNVVAWATTIKAAVAAVDPQVLVGAGMFTNNAVAKKGPVGLLPLNVVDHRFPARAATIMQYSTLEFLDVHVYPSSSNAAAYLKTDMASEEWVLVLVQQKIQSKPVLMGEFGAFQSAFPNIVIGAETVRNVQIHYCQSCGFNLSVGWFGDGIAPQHSQEVPSTVSWHPACVPIRVPEQNVLFLT
jgi:hypothetical protein